MNIKLELLIDFLESNYFQLFTYLINELKF